jgi:multiple sugar transport system permease protein
VSRRRAGAGLAFAGPALALLAVFFFLPVVAALGLSFTDFDIYALGDPALLRFVGLDNYGRLLGSARFWVAVRNTLYFGAVAGPLSIAASFAAAWLVHSRLLHLKVAFRTAFFLPAVTTLVAVAATWRYLYHPRTGLVDQALGLLGVAPIDWLGDPRWAMPAIILLAVWKNFGFNMVILLAGLQNIPASLYEAARIDGAGTGRQLVHVTLPMLAPTLLFVGLMTAIGYLQLFAEPYVMTGGGPSDATLSIVLLMYEEGFRWWNLGYAAAIAFVLFAIIATATLVPLALRRREA